MNYIFGMGEFAQIAHNYLGAAGYILDRAYMREGAIAFDDFKPESFAHVYVAIGDNRARADAVLRLIQRGISRAHYHSRDARIWAKSIGEHCFIFEFNNLQPYVTIGHNCVLWSNNHVGHHTAIGNHVFISSHVCIGGGAEIGDYCFLGMNSTVFDHVKIGANCTIAAGAVVDRDIPDNHTLSRKGVLVKNEVAQAL